MVPLRIEFALQTPWCPPHQGLHLDGLIAWALVQIAQGQGEPVEYQAILDALPFERHTTPLGWVWKASLLRPTRTLARERRYMTARTAVDDMAERMRSGEIQGRAVTRIDTQRGLFKNEANWYTVEHVERVVGWCIADPDQIAQALDVITHIGRLSRLDHGRVGPDVVLEEDPLALTRWAERHMPEPGDGLVPVHGRLHPPYWMGEETTHVWRPPSLNV